MIPLYDNDDDDDEERLAIVPMAGGAGFVKTGIYSVIFCFL